MEEIKAGDIMIGNYIRDIHSENGFFKITTLRNCTAIYGNFYSARYEDLRGIPLTEDILLKAGAKRFEENKFAIMLNDPSTHLVLMKVGTHWYPTIEQVDELGEIRIVFLNYIDYLHQGQNLFKSLTGNDLNIYV